MTEYDKLVQICEDVYKSYRFEPMDNLTKTNIIRDVNIDINESYRRGELKEQYLVDISFNHNTNAVTFILPKILNKIHFTFERIE